MTKKLKLVVTILTLIVLCIPVGIVLHGCGRNRQADIVVTIFPAYDWVKEVLGTNPSGFRVQYLMSNGIDPHFYTPSIQDTAAIINCKLFVYIGEAERNVVPILNQNPPFNHGRRDIAMTQLVETKERENSEDHADGDCDDPNCFHGDIHDEHVWLSLKMARVIVSEIARVLGEIDPKNASTYLNNANAYNAKLSGLDAEFESAVGNNSGRARDTVLFADRFPFRYLMDDYEINWYAAYSTCSTETAITPQRRTFLEGIVNSYNMNVILIIENSTTLPLANEMVAATTATKVRVLNSMQIISSTSIRSGNLTYLSIMQSNLAILKEALT
jgi:zinc transport system substrate-binding protein